MTAPETAIHKTGPKAVLFTHLDDPGPESALEAAKTRIQELAGLFSTLAGHTVVYEHLEDYRMNSAKSEFNPIASLLFDPVWFSRVDLGPEAVETWKLAHSAIQGHEESERIALAVRWVDDAKRSRGIDAFLKLWFALETLAMPDDTNIQPVRERLASIYGMNVEAIDEDFRIGRIYDLRCEIVHNGLRVTLPDMLPAYLNALFVDLLVDELDGESPGHSRAVLDKVGGASKVLPPEAGGDPLGAG